MRERQYLEHERRRRGRNRERNEIPAADGERERRRRRESPTSVTEKRRPRRRRQRPRPCCIYHIITIIELRAPHSADQSHPPRALPVPPTGGPPQPQIGNSRIHFPFVVRSFVRSYARSLASRRAYEIVRRRTSAVKSGRMLTTGTAEYIVTGTRCLLAARG